MVKIPILKLLPLVMYMFALPATAKVAPNFSLPTKDGVVSLSQYKGKVVYLDFWASWCKPCLKSFPWMNEMQDKYKDDLVVIAVNLDNDRSEADKFLAKVDANFTVVFDPKASTAEQYQVLGMPSAYLISAGGEVLHSHVGFVPTKKPIYEKALQLAIAKIGQ